MRRNKMDQQRTMHPEIATKMLLSLKPWRNQWRHRVNQPIENLNELKPDADESIVGRLFAV